MRLIISLFFMLLSFNSCTYKFKASSESELKKSINNISNHIEGDELIAFGQAYFEITKYTTKHFNNKDKDKDIYEVLVKILDGKTVEEIVQIAKDMKEGNYNWKE